MPQSVPELPSSFTLDDVALLLGIVLAAGIAYLIVRRLLTGLGARLIGSANPTLATVLLKHRVLPAVALLTPAVVVAFAGPLLRQRLGWAQDIIVQVLACYVIVTIALALYKLLNALEELFTQEREPGNVAWVHTAFRWLRIAVFAFAVVMGLGVFADVQVTWVLAALGVVVATGSIVFSDMIYNGVSHIILKGRKLVAVGDWLEVPALQIDGEVTAIGSQLIEVQNWDHSLATVTPRFLLTNSYRNWQRMYRVGTRRILRHVYLDAMSVRPLDEALYANARALPGVAAYLDQRVRDFGTPHAAMAELTNVALYRAYLMQYLATHPKVAKDQIWRVTNEDSTGRGLPMLIVAYLRETQDVPFHLLDAEIYEHALAVAPHFGLRLFQISLVTEVPALLSEVAREANHSGEPS